MSVTELLPRILLVDDQPERHSALKLALRERADIEAVHPSEIELDMLQDVDLVSVDEYLGDEWQAEVVTTLGIPASLMNRDGLSVAAAFRSQTRNTSEPSDSVARRVPTFAVSLHTGALATLAEDLPAKNREALTASQHDLEWVFDWAAPNFSSRILELAEASRSLLGRTGQIEDDFGAAWLKVPRAPWTSTAIAQIEDCRPPAHSLARNTNGRSFLRWLAHRVLPYPAFLLSQEHGANLLGIDLPSFKRLSVQLEPMIYKGPLQSFLGDRWWRAGLQQLLVDADVYQWDNARDRANAISKTVGIELTPLSNDQPVVSYDADGSVSDIDADPTTSVRLQQDGWPVWADDPWATLHDAIGDENLRRMVAQADRNQLESAR